MAGELGSLFVSIGASTDQLESGLSDALSMVASAGGKIASTLANVTAVAGTAALGAVTALGAAGVAAWSDMDAAADTLMQRTGATGDALEAMNQSVQNLKATTAGLGESFASIGSTMAEVHQRVGAVGPALEQLTGQLLNLEHIEGAGAASADEFGRLLNSWQVPAEQGSSVLDSLYGAFQKTGTGTGLLAGQLTQFGGALREMGFGLGESISLMSQLDHAGIDGTAAMTGFRTAMAGFASAGQNVQAGLAGAVESIKNASNSTQALQIAIDTFGNRAGPALADAIRQGKLSLDDLTAGVSGFEGAIASASENALDFPDRFAMGMANVQTALVPVGQAIMNLGDAVLPILNIGFGLASQAAGALASALTAIQPAVQAAAQTVVSAFQTMQGILANGGTAGQGATAFLDAIGLSPGIAEVVGSVIDGVISTVQSGINTLRSVVSGIASGGVAGGVGALLAAIGFDSASVSQITSTINQIISTVQTAIGTLRAAIASGASAGSGASAVLQALGLDASTANTVGAVINQVISAVQQGISTLRSVITSFQSGGAGGGGQAIIAALGLDPALVSQATAVLSQVQSAIQGGLTAIAGIIIGAVGVIAAHWQNFVGALAGAGGVLVAITVVGTLAGAILALLNPITLLVAAGAALGAAWATNWGNIQGIVSTAGAVILGVLQTVGGIVAWFAQNWQAVAVVVGTAGAVIASAFAVIAAANVVGFVTTAIAAFQGLGIVIASAGGIVGAFSALFPGLAAAIAVILSPLGLVIAGIAAFAIAYATNFGGVRDNTNIYVEQIKANLEQLAGYWDVLGQAISKFANNDYSGAFNTLTEGISRVNATFDERMAGIAAAAQQGAQAVAEGAASISGSLGEMAADADAKTQIMAAVTNGNIGAIPGIVASHMQSMVGAFGAGMASSVAVVADGAARIQAIVLNAQQMVANMPKAAGQAGERFDDQTAPAAPSGPSPAAIQATQRAAVSFQGYGAAMGGVGSAAKAAGDAAKGAGSAAKTAEEKIQQAAAAINAVTETVKRLQEFLKDGLDKLVIGDQSDQLMVVIGNIATFGKRMAETFAAAATGLKDDAFKAAQTLSQGISAAASGIGAVVGLLPKLWEFINSPEWGEMQGSLGAMLGVAGQLINWGRQLFDVMAAASAGVTEESAKAAQALAQGIGASAQAVSAVIGLLPKLWEFVTSPVFDEIMANLPMLAQVAGKLIKWGKVLFDMFSAAAEGVTAETAQACQNLQTGITAAAQSITALIDLIPRLLDFAAWDQGMAVLEGPGRAAIMSLVAKLSALGRLIFDVFAAAGADINAKSLLAAQNLAAGVKSASDGLQDVIKLTVALLDFSHWSVGFETITNGSVRAGIVYVAQRLAELGRLIMDAWGNAAGQLSSYTIQGAKALTDGVKQASDGLLNLIQLLPQLLSFSLLATGFAILNDDAIRALIIYTAQRIMSLGRVIVDQFSKAGADLSSFTLQGAANLTAGVKSAGEALTTLISLLPSLLNFSLQAQGWAILNDPATQGAIVDIAVKLGALGQLIYRAFYLGAQSIQQNIPNAALALTDALKSASDAMSTLMTLGPSLLNFASQTQGWRILNDDTARAALYDIGYKLGELAQNIYRAFYLGAQSVQQNIPVAAMALTDALKSASDAMQTLMTEGPALLAFTATEGGWRIVTDERVQDNLTYIAGKLGELAARIYRAFYLASSALLTDIPVAASQLTDALASAANALKSVMETGPALLAFAATDTGWRIVTNESVQNDLVYIAQRLSQLAARVYAVFAQAAGDLTSDVVAGSKALADGIVAASAGLVSVTEVAQKLLAFNADAQGWRIITDGSLQNDIVYIARRLSDLARRMYDEFAAAAGDLTSDAVAGSRALADGLSAMMDGLSRTLDLAKLANALIKEPANLPTPDDAVAAFTPLINWAKEVARRLAELTGVTALVENNASAVSGVLSDANGVVGAVLDSIKLVASLIKDQPQLPTPDDAVAAFTPLIAWAKEVAHRLAEFAGQTEIALQNMGDVSGVINDMLGVASAVLDAIKQIGALLKEPPLLPTVDDAYNVFTPLITWAQGLAGRLSAFAGQTTLALQNMGDVAGVVNDTVGVAGAVLDAIKQVAALLKEPPNLPSVDDAARVFEPLITWAKDLAARLSAFAAQTQLTAQNMGDVAGVVNDVLGIASAVLDAIKQVGALLKDPPGLPSVDDAVRVFTPLIDWAKAVAAQISALAAQTQLTAQNMGDVSGVLNDMLGAVQSVLDTLKLLTSLTQNPANLPSPAAAVVAFLPLVRWGQVVAQQLAQAVGSIQLAAQNAGDVGSVLGDMLGAVKQVLDTLKLTAALVEEPASLPSPAEAVIAFLPLVRWGQVVSQQLAQAVGSVVLATHNAGDVSSVLGDMLGAVKQVVDAGKLVTDLLTTPASLPTPAQAVAVFTPLIEWAQEVAVNVAQATGLVTIAENSLGALGSTLGDVITVIENGLKLPDLLKKLNSFTGINFTIYGPKFDLLIDSLKQLLQQFTRRAQSANFTEEAQKAVAAFSTGAGQAIDTLSRGLDFAQKIADSINLRLPAGPQIDSLLAPVFALIDNVTAAFTAHAGDVNQDQLAEVVAYATGVKAFFDTIQTAIEAVQAAAGLHIEGSGFNNINRLLQNLFTMFEGFSANADAVNAVTAAISSLLGGIENLVAASGVTSGQSWVDGFVAAIEGGAADIQAAIAAALGGASAAGSGQGSGSRGSGGNFGAGSGQGGGITNNNVTNNYNNTAIVLNMNVPADSAGYVAGQTIDSLRATY